MATVAMATAVDATEEDDGGVDRKDYCQEPSGYGQVVIIMKSYPISRIIMIIIKVKYYGI